MKSKKGFTLIELLIVVVIIGILALAAIPLISSNTNEAKSSEARAALGTLKDRFRVMYVNNNNLGVAAWDVASAVTVSELTGKYYAGGDYSVSTAFTATATAPGTLRAAANGTTTSPQVTMAISNLGTGAATITSP